MPKVASIFNNYYDIQESLVKDSGITKIQIIEQLIFKRKRKLG